MEDAAAHFRRVIEWPDDCSKNPNQMTNFKLELEYVSTASSKFIHQILDALDTMCLNGHKVLVEWHYYEVDEDMLELDQVYNRFTRSRLNSRKLNMTGQKIYLIYTKKTCHPTSLFSINVFFLSYCGSNNFSRLT